jgi:hypothetical protein
MATSASTAVRVITRACVGVFVAGVAGLIIASVAGNNNGVVLSIGAAIALAAVVLMTVNTVTVREHIDAFEEAADEEAAQRLEQHITRLVDQGVDENDVRTLVREARRLGRR